ncbi:regulatory protein, Fis family [Thiohalospira halophila DSM 15071]|uniref:Regulatory protein, Fis family n=1 Tax=Thiohalospira halophila DSM 15071 TaxID=1123397 RepID=A0A1I1P7B7_9GAMM|nr:sigma 54-interacting transcriptional regulator [Thiohalospira halophila]SFD05615.1 regulatory protein, Fis family [Thiohalospira halophila DSM 15071]
MDVFEQALPTQSPNLQTVLRSASLVAASDVTVLLLGESGTGKGRLAEAIHAASPRAAGPMVAVNCGAIPDSLAESELFGHRRGAFTGAVDEAPGRIRAASGGTLFLDEVAELPPSAQAKLLRFLETGEVQTVGEATPRRADARVVAATHRDLEAEVAAGRFRADLFYRLNIVPLEIPALRERRCDIPGLARRLLVELADSHGVERPSFTKAALLRLRDHGWPGNVRELRNLCERTAILLPGREVDASNLPAGLAGESTAGADAAVALPAEGVRLEDVEADLIRQALARTEGNRSRAARLLGISRHTLLYRLRKHAIA